MASIIHGSRCRHNAFLEKQLEVVRDSCEKCIGQQKNARGGTIVATPKKKKASQRGLER